MEKKEKSEALNATTISEEIDIESKIKTAISAMKEADEEITKYARTMMYGSYEEIESLNILDLINIVDYAFSETKSIMDSIVSDVDPLLNRAFMFSLNARRKDLVERAEWFERKFNMRLSFSFDL